jgi:hypothetical protein
MPIPTYKFEDPSAGLPPRPVPVRFACLAVDLPPSFFALLVTGGYLQREPLLEVYEYDEPTGRIGQVHPENYRDIVPVDAFKEPGGEFVWLPRNHFVWSDALVNAYSFLINSPDNPDYVVSAGYAVRWKPALWGAGNVISECVDIAKISAQFLDSPRIKQVGRAWNISYKGVDVPVKHSKGMLYLSHLLLHSDKDVSVADLNFIANPHAHGDGTARTGVGKLDCDGQVADASEQELTMQQDLGDAGPALDTEALQRLRSAEAKLDVQIKTAQDNGKTELVAHYEKQKVDLQRFIRGRLNIRGASRTEGSTTDKMRKAISKAIAGAIKEIAVVHPPLGLHLEASIHTGINCSYKPLIPTKWTA